MDSFISNILDEPICILDKFMIFYEPPHNTPNEPTYSCDFWTQMTLQCYWTNHCSTYMVPSWKPNFRLSKSITKTPSRSNGMVKGMEPSTLQRYVNNKNYKKKTGSKNGVQKEGNTYRFKERKTLSFEKTTTLKQSLLVYIWNTQCQWHIMPN